MKTMNFTFGSDPEFILADKKGKLKSAIGIIEGNKKKKINLGGNFFFYDNVLAECTIMPASNVEEAIENFKKSLISCAQIVHPFRMTSLASGTFDEIELNHADARKSGCESENCAYDMRVVPTSRIRKIFKNENFRTAGGHVHIGTSLGGDYENCIMLVRMLDLFLGIPMLIMDNSKSSMERRRLYGQAGRYRQPEHGVEYRTPSNFWICSPKLVGLVFEICQLVVNLTAERIYDFFWSVDHETLNSDKFWNACGDPSRCHKCHGYDVVILRRLFSTCEKSEITRIWNLISKYFPDKIKSEIFSLTSHNLDIYREWGITSSGLVSS